MRQQQREFDSSAEAAGAPVECSEPSYTPRVLRRTDRALFGTVTTPDGIEYAQEWAPNGHARGLMERRGPSPRDLVMVPLDWVEGKPVYHGDVVYQGRRKIAVNASQSEAVTGRVPPWAGATLAPHEPQNDISHPIIGGQRFGKTLAMAGGGGGGGMTDEIGRVVGRGNGGVIHCGGSSASAARANEEIAAIAASLARAEPQPVVQTNMTPEQAGAAYIQCAGSQRPHGPNESLVRFASAAIARAIADGQVVPANHPNLPRIRIYADEGPAVPNPIVEPATPEWRASLDKILAAINAVQEAAPRIMLEQVAAHMQQECVMQLLEQGEALGWMGRDKAADIVRRIDINPVVDKVMGVNREL